MKTRKWLIRQNKGERQGARRKRKKKIEEEDGRMQKDRYCEEQG